MSKELTVRHKPIILKAWRFNGTLNLPEWAQGSVWWQDAKLIIRESGMIVRQGDYIVLGINREIYPISADIFWHLYEEHKNGNGKS